MDGSRPPFELTRIDHVLLLVRGMERSLAFYERVLGARVESRMPRYAMVEVRAGTSHIDLVDVEAAEGAWALPPAGGGRNVDHVALRIDAPDEAALRAHLAAHSVEIVEERIEKTLAGASLSLYVRDPSGTVLELLAPRPPSIGSE